ncbi:hypothetical protein [Oecophyllibacter saccharovorans]|uniref:hypothetical protein n=1 Tax=Oecophyllibacter saccharovorans TaxID=2558360 RepID=UPI001883ABEA|nr:hypothetical protein [Oecophyllibacter saccharovorans]
MSSVVQSSSASSPPGASGTFSDPDQPHTQPHSLVIRVGLFVLGLVIVFFGLFFIIAGLQLVWYGGSWYYLLCGPVLVAAGLGLLLGQRWGGWLYLLALAATLLWTIWEVGFEWWGWLPRLFGPTLIGLLVLAALPFMGRPLLHPATAVPQTPADVEALQSLKEDVQ